MHLKKKKKIQAILIVICVITLVVAILFRLRLFPFVEDLATTKVINEMSNIINDAVDEQVSVGNVDYNDMVYLEKDINGNITALKTNMAKVNYLKTQILQTVNEEIMDLSVDRIGIPVGNVLFPEFFSGRGFYIPVRILSIRSSDGSFTNSFDQAGINQTLHQIVMHISISVTILTPSGTENVVAQSQVVVAETIIVGSVPNSYLNIPSTS